TWTLGARDESEIGERAADRGGLGILETSDRIDVAVALALAGPTCRGRSRVARITVDERLERDRAVDVRDQLCIDTTLRIARVEHLDPLGDGRVLFWIEKGIGLRHRALDNSDWIPNL